MAFRMTHPDSDQTIEVSAESVPMYQSQGWETSPHAHLPADSDGK